MKPLKTLGLAGLAAAILTVYAAAPASATVLIGPGHEPLGAGAAIAGSLETGTTASLASTSEDPIVTCTASSVEGKVTNAGSATTTVSGSVSHLTFSGGCSVTVDQSKNGTLEIHHIAGTTNGTVTGSGFYVTVHSPFVGACNYGLAANTDLGIATGSTSGSGTMHVNAIVTEQAPTRVLCPDTTRWIAAYVLTSPASLFVEGQGANG